MPEGTTSTGEAAGEARLPVFEHVSFLDSAEEAIRKRLAKVRILDRVFLLSKPWIFRITMLMIVLSVFWGAVGGFDIFGYQTQAYAWALGQPLHLSNQEIYSALTLHAIRMLFGFAQQFQMAIFGVLVVTALGIKPRLKWMLYSSVFLLNLSVILIEGPFYLMPQFNDNYFPAEGWYFYSPLGIRGLSSYVISPLWYIGWILLCASVIIWAAWVIVHLRDWWVAHGGLRGTERLPPFLLFILATVILIPLGYVTVLASAVWDTFNYFGVGPVAPLLNQLVFWFFGHAIVYLLFLIPIVAYYLLVPIFAKRPIYSYRFAFAAAVMFTVLTPILAIHHLYLTSLPVWSAWLTMVLTFAIIIPSAITFFTVWMTMKGVKASEWEWNAVTMFLALSFAGSIAGGLTGPDNNTISFDVDLHNTLFIVSHFHTLALLSITAGAFALTYALLPVLVGRFWYSPRLAQAHFAGSAIGWAGLVMFMDFLGTDGILRRGFMFQLDPSLVFDQVMITVFVIITLLAQLFLVANIVLTIFRGKEVHAEGLSLNEAIRAIASSTHPHPTVPIKDVPFERKMPRARREGAERAWVATVAVLLVAVIVAATPAALSTSNLFTSPADAPAGTEWVTLTGEQYYWNVQESGPITGTFANVLVVHAGQWVAVNATATTATEGFYIPFRSLPVVDVQVVPYTWSYELFQAPSQPGVYGMPNAEFNGPWFGQDVGVLIVLPPAGGSTLGAYSAAAGAGDVYNPPVWSAAGTQLVSDQEGIFNSSVPGPTLIAPAGPVSFAWTVPMASIGIDNYLVNVTTNDPNGQQNWLNAHNDTLPYDFGVYTVSVTGPTNHSVATLDPVAGTVAPIKVGPRNVESMSLAAGVYLYGLVTPIPYVYDPSGQSSWMTGSEAGNVMGLWGVLWVSP
ncbi:MAG TPA: cbb3-type cytochrome c oxidase subunit I [Thermoplasmata archaeon]|nr:cbb3-type cytochrome c oxidase subunit I [Thermoplasmata archaeon]